MTAGSAKPSTGGTRAGNCQQSKDLGSYDPLPASFSIPRRCESAHPSMEGSSARLDHLISQQIGSLEATLRNLGCGPDDSKSEEHLHSDPSYFKYYNSKVNLNPRLLVSRESCHLMNRFGKAGEWRPSPLDYCSSTKSSTHCSTLSRHKHEPEDDRSPRLDSSSTEDARCGSGRSTSDLGSHSSNLVNLIQDNQHTNSKRIKHSTSTTGSSNAPPSTDRHNVNGDCNGHGIRDAGAHVDQSVKELDSLKEMNKAMQQELKELHERYSEISLNFAEVEGERQQL